MTRHNAQYTTPQLRDLKAKCHDIVPVWGRYEGMPPAEYLPRSKHDPKPWAVNGRDGFRYSAYELTATPQHKPEVTDAAWVEQRHMIEDTSAFVRANLACAGVPQGVAA